MLYYTGAQQAGTPQGSPDKSLGGYVSSSPISNGLLNNIFGNVDQSILAQGIKQYRIIAFQNQTPNIIGSLKIYVRSTSENPFSKLRFGAMLNSLNKCQESYFEQLPNQYSLPAYASLRDAGNPSQYIEINDIPAGQYIGIFLERSIENSSSGGGNSSISCDTLYNMYKADEHLNQIQTDEFEIVLTIDSAIIHWGTADIIPAFSDQYVEENASGTGVSSRSEDIDFILDFSKEKTPKFFWFAEPREAPIKTEWQDTRVRDNHGTIGESSDLFKIEAETDLYRIYITNYPVVFNYPILFS